MIVIPVSQGSSEWRLLRYGIVTASEADNLITPAKWEATKGDKREKYLCQKIGERIALQETEHITNPATRCNAIENILSRFHNDAMEHGHVSEPRAVNAYEFLSGNKTEVADFIMNDAKTAGVSLDRKIVCDGSRAVEIKCPFSLAVYIGYCLNKSVDSAHLPQLMFQMWIAELESIDIYAWYEGRNESEAITVLRNEDKIKELAKQHAAFNDKLESTWQKWGIQE